MAQRVYLPAFITKAFHYLFGEREAPPPPVVAREMVRLPEVATTIGGVALSPSDVGIQCPHCSFMNARGATECEMCKCTSGPFRISRAAAVAGIKRTLAQMADGHVHVDTADAADAEAFVPDEDDGGYDSDDWFEVGEDGVEPTGDGGAHTEADSVGDSADDGTDDSATQGGAAAVADGRTGGVPRPRSRRIRKSSAWT